MRPYRPVPRRPLTRPAPRLAAVLGAVLIALLIALTVGGVTSAATALDSRTPADTEVAERVAAGATEVTVGFYAVNLQGLDQHDSSYFADFFMWMRWTGDRDPTATIELTNNIERWGLTMAQVYDKPKELPSGEKVQQFRVQGKFFQPLDLTDYPLDSHQLTLIVEDTTFAADELVYVPDEEGVGLDPELKIPGWSIEGSELSIVDHTYDTSFGEGDTPAAARTYSAATFEIGIERPMTFFLWKLLLPLVIVLLLAGSVLFVHPSLTEVRLAAPATALLSLVFLQQAYSSTLPEIGSLVLLDQIYALAYGLIIVLILTTIVTSYWVRGGDEPSTRRAFRLDHVAAASSLGIFLIGSSALVLIAVAG